MAAPSSSLTSTAPLMAAPELADYHQFAPCPTPEGSEATRAFKGFIRPFSDNETAQRVLRAIERGIPLQVYGGRVDVDTGEAVVHPLDRFLVGMAQPFTVLLLDFAGTEHPRAYLLDPPMIPRFSECGHLRHDKTLQIGAHSYPALCIYSGSLHHFENGRSRLEQFLDQTSTYLAKYLIWLRTRKLYRLAQGRFELVRSPRPGERLHANEVSRSKDLFWIGYWLGRAAPSGPEAHLATIKPEDECWCWSGKPYCDCCRAKDAEAVVEMNRRRLVDRLMRAVHARLTESLPN